MYPIDPDNSSTPDLVQISEETVAPAVAQGQIADARALELGCFLPGYIVGGSYEVIDLLGSGGMGRVYRAKHVSMPAIYALKVLITDQLNDNKVMRFQNEAQAIAKLNHPNIIAIYNFGLHDGRLPFYVMDLLDGENLHNILYRDGPAPPEVALPIFIEVAAGLGHAHRKGIMHRDVKPANIVLLSEPDTRGARVKVVDFGIVKFAEEIKPDAQKLTALGAVCGSPSYMSPEQATGGRTDPRSDIYSLGCTLFQTLTGRVPFHGRNATETMMMHYEQSAPTLASMGGGRTYSEDLELLIAKFLAKQPMDRYQTMDQAAQDMRNVMEGKPLGTPAPLPQTTPTVAPLSPPGIGSISTATAITRGGADGRILPVSTRATTHDIYLLEEIPDDLEVPNKETAQGPVAVPGAPVTDGPMADDIAADVDPALDEKSSEYTTSERKIFDPTAVAAGPKLAAAIVVSVCLAGIIGFFIWQALQPIKPIVTAVDTGINRSGATDSSPSPTAVSQSPSTTAAGAASHSAQHPTSLQGAEAIGPADLEVSEPVELTKARYFSTTILMNGREYLQFDFPTQRRGEALAWIASSVRDSQRTEGKVLIEKGPIIYLMPLAGATRVPQFFEKFRPGEIAGFLLAPTSEGDEMFIDCCRIPGLSRVLLSKCTKLTDKIMPALSKLNLTVFDAPGLVFDSETLSRAHFWQNLETLSLARCKNITPILKKVAGSKKIETLDVTDTKLGAADYQLIGRMPNLKALNITSNKVTAEDLRALAGLRHLETLSAVYLRMADGSLVAELKHFPALKNVVLIKGFFKEAEMQKLKQECPDLRVKQFGPEDIAKMSRNGVQDHW